MTVTVLVARTAGRTIEQYFDDMQPHALFPSKAYATALANVYGDPTTKSSTARRRAYLLFLIMQPSLRDRLGVTFCPWSDCGMPEVPIDASRRFHRRCQLAMAHCCLVMNDHRYCTSRHRSAFVDCPDRFTVPTIEELRDLTHIN